LIALAAIHFALFVGTIVALLRPRGEGRERPRFWRKD
jgi:hypothetical protein